MFRVITETAQNRFGPFLYLGIIILFTTCAYLNSLNSPFIWDDQDLIIDNSLIKDYRLTPKIFTTDLYYGSGKNSNFYRPLQNISYMLDYSIARLNPLAYHIHNLILHLLNSSLIFYIVSIFFSGPLAFLTSLLFAVHPIHVEAVTYISGRADLIVSFFMLFSSLLYIQYRMRQLRRFYWYSLFAFLCALLSKELALIFPLAIVLFEKTFFNKEKSPYSNKFASIAGFLCIDTLYIIWRLFIFGSKPLIAHSTKYTFITRLLFFFKSVFLYVIKLIIPLNLTMSYTVDLPKGIFDFWVLAPLISILIILVLLPSLYKNKKIIFFGICWFFIFLFPQSNLFAINAFLADHFIYLSSVGFFLILSYLFMSCAFKNGTNKIS